VEAEVDQRVTIPWETHVPLPIKLPLGLFNLLPYMLNFFDWDNYSLDDFKAKLVSYWACLKGWDEWIDNVFVASFGL
jgi:hypothetical protein